MKKTIVCTLIFLLCIMSAITVSARKNDISFLDQSGLSVKDDAYIIGIPEKSQASVVTDRLADPADVYLKNDNGVICEASEVVGTGYKLSVIQHSVVNKTIEAVVRGDISGDGQVTSVDYLSIKRVFNGDIILEGAYLEAADADGDGRMLSTDYLRIKKHFQGTQSLYTPLPSVTPVPAAKPTANPNSMGDTVEYANQVANQPQAYFKDESRDAFNVANANMELSQGIKGNGSKNVRAFQNKAGGVYFSDTMDIFFQAPGKSEVFFKDSEDPLENIPAVCTRLGIYYYEAHIRHINFPGYSHLMDLSYNVLPESLHINYEMEYKEAYTAGSVLGVETKIAKSTVRALQIVDKNGKHSDVNGLDTSSVEYVAFDIKDAGVVGIIYPKDTQCTKITVASEADYYVVRSMIEIPESVVGTKYNLNIQLYNDATHSFEGVEEAAYIERNPVQVTVTNTTNSQASYAGYDSATGTYRIAETNNWYGFNTAYNNPNYYMYAGLKVQNDGHDRPVYFWVNSNVGGMECASLLDGNNKLLAVPMEVCKNFAGEMEDVIYDPTDAAFGDTFFPVYLKKNETTSCTAVQYIQNWGKYALQQVSSIQYFNTAYYHLSTGASESTCFMPYGGAGKDGKIVGDFRGCSGDIWPDQPQFNHAGNFYATCENNSRMSSECTGAEILSTGPTYGKVGFSYMSDDDKYKFSLTQTEFPQNDESRNYCTLKVEFLKDTVVNNARNSFQLLTYHTTMGTYKNMAYLDKDGKMQTVETSNLSSVYNLHKGGAFYTLYTNDNINTENIGVIIKDYSVTVNGGEQWDGNMAIRAYNSTDWSLMLGAGRLSFKKGDTITVNFVLLPYGKPSQTNFDNVVRVYEDSAVNPIQVTTSVGSVVYDPFIPIVSAVDNKAQFTLSGSRNLNTVQINGFTSDKKPVIEERLADGSWVVYDNAVEAFDGYGAHYNKDNTYGFSFVVDMGENGAARTFRIAQ